MRVRVFDFRCDISEPSILREREPRGGTSSSGIGRQAITLALADVWGGLNHPMHTPLEAPLISGAVNYQASSVLSGTFCFRDQKRSTFAYPTPGIEFLFLGPFRAP